MTVAALARRAAPASDMARLLAMFHPPVAPSIGIARSANDYVFYVALGGNRYWAFGFKNKVFGAYTLNLLDTHYVQTPGLTIDHQDAGITRTGTWTGPASGQYTSSVIGDRVDWTSPAGVTRIIFGVQISANGGISAVDIDSDPTAANALPTAQDLVTAGTLVAWALTTSAKSASDVAISTASPLVFSGTFAPILTASDVGRSIVIPAAVIGYGADVLADHTAGVEVGAGWTTSTSGSFYGGNARFAALASNTNTWTSPVAARVGVLTRTIASGGYARILVDGSTANANLLPTAQDEVTAGRLVSSALVANGGTLNPTDRLLDTYSVADTFQAVKYVADNLASTTHTVAVEVTGYKRTAASLARIYVDGFVSNVTAAASSLTTTIATVTGPTGGTVASPATASTSGQSVTLAAGTVTPTQRVLDTYFSGGATNTDVLVGELTPGVHTFRATILPYKHTSSGQTRLSQRNIGYSSPSILPTTPGMTWQTIIGSFTTVTGENCEYALRAYPTDDAGIDTDFVGNNHGYDEQVGLAFTLDGAVVTPTDLATTWGTRLVVTRTSKLYHRDLTPPAYLADVVTTYTFDGFGFTIENQITWIRNSLQLSTGYMSMLTLAPVFTRVTTLGHGVAERTDEASGVALVKASRESPFIVSWTKPGNWAVAMFLESLEGVKRWVLHPETALWMQDRTPGNDNKMYATRSAGTSENMGIGDVWRSKARYMMQRFEDPDAVFSALPVYS